MRFAIQVLPWFLLPPAIGAIRPVQSQSTLSGTFRPSTPPENPTRRTVGSGCVVDLKQAYALDGSLVGKMVVDFRIFVAGDCTRPPGTFDEHWIAYGTYTVRVRETEYTGALIYLATAKAGGKVEGTLTLGGELPAELEVAGNFSDGYMRYSSAEKGSGSR